MRRACQTARPRRSCKIPVRKFKCSYRILKSSNEVHGNLHQSISRPSLNGATPYFRPYFLILKNRPEIFLALKISGSDLENRFRWVPSGVTPSGGCSTTKSPTCRTAISSTWVSWVSTSNSRPWDVQGHNRWTPWRAGKKSGETGDRWCGENVDLASGKLIN